MQHIPVLRNEVEKYLDVKRTEIVVDTTLGLGGHSLDIVKKLGDKGRLIAFDQDQRNIREARERLREYESKITFVYKNFRYLKIGVTEAGADGFDKILFDLGLSSPHVDEAERGFSFQKEGPLDMRFDQSQPLTAGEIVNEYKEDELFRIFREYGEEPLAKKFSRLIVERRKEKPFETTIELAEFIARFAPKGKKTHPATRIFQALRIAANDEMGALSEALLEAMELLAVGGRIVVISYHSLEDRLVKHFFKNLLRPEVTPEKAMYQTFGDPLVENLTGKPVIPDQSEIENNPRARSAKLRAYKKIQKI